jgi:transposase
MAVSLPDARQLSDEVLEALRLRALRGCELGYTESQVADFLGVARETVCRWWSAYADQGLDGLPHERTGRPVGSGRTLTDEQAKHLQQLLDSKAPEQLGIASPLWTRRAVRDLIARAYSIPMPVRTVGEYLKRWGYTRKKARRHSRDQDPEEVREWLEETYPALENRAEEEDAEIHWCDETGVAADEHPGYGYAREGQPAQAEVPDSHIRVNMISTITNAGAVHFMTYQETMTAALFIVFLSRLIQGASRKIFLMADRLRAHDAAAVHAWLAEHSDKIEMFLLPRYAPERNADEYLNNDLKGGVNAAGLPHNKEELGACISTFMEKLKQLPERIKHYFKHPCIQYAAAHSM